MTDNKVIAVAFASLHTDPFPRDPGTGSYVHERTGDAPVPGPTLNALANPKSTLFGRVSHLYYLCHPARDSRRRGATAADVAKETRHELEKRVERRQRPGFVTVELAATKPPDDYAELYDLTTHELQRIRRLHPDAEIVLLLGLGTNAMNTALLLAHAAGVVGGSTRVVSVARNEGARLNPDRPVRDVVFELPTVLHTVGKTSPMSALDAVDGVEGLSQARSPALVAAIEAASRAAPTPAPVLLRGERGVGKTTFASLIRASSPYRKRRDDEWPALACGQFPEPQILLAELCGVEKGSYSGVAAREGLFAMAHDDTLFLDEIHDLPGPCQRVLMHVLETGGYYPLGAKRRRTSRFRLVSGTNASDEALGRDLGLDFLDRIRDIEIEIPPLRDCREDLPWMWATTWRKQAPAMGVATTLSSKVEARVLDALAVHALPGNWRDIRRLAVTLAIAMKHDASTRSVDRVLAEFSRPRYVAAQQSRLAVPRRSLRSFRAAEERLGGPGFPLLRNALARGEEVHEILREHFPERNRAKRVYELLYTYRPDVITG